MSPFCAFEIFPIQNMFMKRRGVFIKGHRGCIVSLPGDYLCFGME
jgi:hypothetical protein